MSNILVTGAHGPLGNEMQRLAEQDAENMYVFTDVAELDITDLDAIRRCMTEYRISIVVNCAAICDIRSCHSDEFPSKVKKPAFSVLEEGVFTRLLFAIFSEESVLIPAPVFK